ncbi:MAG: hypothetical protein LBC29_02030, partial [Propionibacteriaceae bacterium]|nr:hypothetical protein [Propionibacteriaceae bacterium]
NSNGTFEEDVDVPAPAGVKVEVWNALGRVAGSVTDSQGRWIVNDLPAPIVDKGVASGEYYVVIPATEFALGGRLYGYRASSHNVQNNPDTDLNENTDHHAIADVGAQGRVAGGVRSVGSVTLSAEVNAQTGIVVRGLEPLGENVKGLRGSALSGDDYMNLTLDLALELAPEPEEPEPESEEPGEPEEPEPGEPREPEEPEPGEPREPEEPEPGEPHEPGEPGEPGEPEEPDPHEPGEPSEPSEPGEPEPGEPEEPEEPKPSLVTTGGTTVPDPFSLLGLSVTLVAAGTALTAPRRRMTKTN